MQAQQHPVLQSEGLFSNDSKIHLKHPALTLLDVDQQSVIEDFFDAQATSKVPHLLQSRWPPGTGKTRLVTTLAMLFYHALHT